MPIRAPFVISGSVRTDESDEKGTNSPPQLRIAVQIRAGVVSERIGKMPMGMIVSGRESGGPMEDGLIE
jgi:hypothetical protein